MTIAPPLLHRAVEVYLAIAYPGGQWSPAVARRLQWRGTEAPIRLDQPPFEPVLSSNPEQGPCFALRLGNLCYPHMKLEIQSWANDAGFLISVNTHDQVTPPPNPETPEAIAFRELQAENLRMKREIEAAWEHEQLPTFNQYLRDYLESKIRP